VPHSTSAVNSAPPSGTLYTAASPTGDEQPALRHGQA
jgi:hypothetical protein